jgi:signal transduction histidine kinase
VDTTGLVAAVLGVEADVDYADDLLGLRQSLYLSSAISIGIGLLFGILFYVVQRRMAASEKSVFMSQSQANLGRMVAVVSHEIKNPLMIMRASAESLQKKTASPETEFIVEEIDRLNQIVTGYLDFASGKKMVKAEPVDISQLLRSIADQFAPRLKREGVSLRVSIQDGKIMLEADPIALRQVIINMILNGAEAAAVRNNGQIELKMEQRGRKIIISVEDNGPGMDKKQLKNIFEPFYTTKTTGSGLGLFHSRRLIEEMGGNIVAESKSGGPTIFSIILSVADKG